MYPGMFFNPWKPWWDLGGACLEYYSRLGSDFYKFGLEVQSLELMKLTEKPQWQTPNVEVFRTNKFVLRQFSQGTKGNPIVILPPIAGHDDVIVDLNPKNSLVATAIRNCSNPVYVIEQFSADPSRRNETFDDLMLQTDQCINLIGREVHLTGLCQGGWQAGMYASLFPEKVCSLVAAGSPFDCHAGDGKLKEWVDQIPMGFYDFLLSLGGGIMLGNLMIAGFKNMNPWKHYVQDYVDLFHNINDLERVRKSRNYVRWFSNPRNIPGWYRQAVKDLFKGNRLIKSELEVLGRLVNLGNYKGPVTLIAGRDDNITPPPQILNRKFFPGASHVTMINIPGCSHLGLFISSKALKEFWPWVFRSLKWSDKRIDQIAA